VVVTGDHGEALGTTASSPTASSPRTTLRVPLIVSQLGGDRRTVTALVTCLVAARHIDLRDDPRRDWSTGAG
jgi:arylsulfatase A-like enzyme